MSAVSKGKRVRITVRLPIDIAKRVRNIAKAEGSTVNDVICHHVDKGTLPIRTFNWTKKEVAILSRQQPRMRR